MDTIEFRGRRIPVREVARPDGASILYEDETGTAYLEYLVSVGPHKIDRAVVHRLPGRDYAAYREGRLDLAMLARNLAEHDQDSGAFERRD